MSSTNTEVETTSPESPSNASPDTPGESGASVDKIRDIIFGSQIKNYEARFARLEESLVRETAELKESLRKRCESIESFFKTETEALGARLRAEKEERTSLLSNLERETKETHDALGRRINDVDTSMNEGDSNLRRELMTESRKLLEELDQRYDSIRSLMDARVLELRTQKVDRALMSDLFREIAAHLDNDPPSASE